MISNSKDKSSSSYTLKIRHVIHVFVQKSTDLTQLVPIIEHDGESIFEVSSDFSDFVHPVTYHVISSDGRRSEWIVKMYDLPVIVIETPDGEEIKSRTKRKENCKVSVVQDNRMMPIDFAGIRGRGNSYLDGLSSKAL